MGGWVSFAEIKSRVRMEQLLRAYRVAEGLRRGGPDQLRGRCPIHQGDGLDTFHVNLARNLFHCFACRAGGNVLDFVAAMERCSVREAALRLQQSGLVGARARVRADTGSPTAAEKLVTKEMTANPPLRFSLDVDATHPYLQQRGVDPGTARQFGIGWFGGEGLMSRRIAIPIHDAAGRLVAYCGRTIDGGAPRYRFPAGFQKSRVLFNYHRARVTGAGEVIVVEGFFDCLRVHQAGFPCVVALTGVALSAAQRQLLIHAFRQVKLLLDGDRAGWEAAEPIRRALTPACLVTAVRLGPGIQPDQMSASDIHRAIQAERRQPDATN
jgi:DNA primase